MSPPLAGRPPFATDQPDSLFDNQPQRTPRPRKQNIDTTAHGGARDSAYTAFDSYFVSGDGHDHRASGVGDIGRGLMNTNFEGDTDDEELQPRSRTNGQPMDKHRALYAAATRAAPNSSPPSNGNNKLGQVRERRRPAPLQTSSDVRIVQQPQPVVHAHPDNLHLSQYIEPSSPPANTSPTSPKQLRPPTALLAAGGMTGRRAPAHAASPLQWPRTAHVQGQELLIPPRSPGYAISGNPLSPLSPLSPTNRSPQPLPPPQTPIHPVFATPRDESSAIRFEKKAEILRGNSEETLLARGTGGKGDDFWRRFSMVAKVEARGGSKKSAWLRETEHGTTRLATWAWVVGIVLLIAIGAGIGVGWYFTHNKPAPQPVAIGGSANEALTSTSTTSTHVSSVRPTKVTAAPVPTNTSNNNKREALLLVPPAHRRSNVNRIVH